MLRAIYVVGHLEIFPTWNDAKEFINKFEDGTNKKDPRVIGFMAKQIIKMLLSDMKRIHMETVIMNGVFEENA